MEYKINVSYNTIMNIITFIRSLLFNITFFVFTGVWISSLYVLCFIMKRSVILALVKLWAKCAMFLMHFIVGIRYKVEGLDFYKKNKNAIIASRHESYWETIFFHVVIDDPIFVLKKELLNILCFGTVLKKLSMIAIDRENTDIRKMVKDASNALNSNKTVVLFPEGTRIPYGKSIPIKKGAMFVSKVTKAKIIPVMLNAGRLWPRRGFVKKAGEIRVVFNKPIEYTDDITDYLESIFKDKI